MELYFTNGEVAIITGASSGIGAGTAVKLAQLGVMGLCITARKEALLKEVQNKCVEQSGGRLNENNVIIVTGSAINLLCNWLF